MCPEHRPPKNTKSETRVSVVARNRKAYHDFEILESLEAGIALTGTEVKSVRGGKLNLSDAYAAPQRGEIVLKNLHISPYEMASAEQHEPTRPRRLLLHKKEIRKLTEAVSQKGLTIVPLEFYFKRGLLKVSLGLARGKKHFDKRQTIAEKESQRQIARAVRHEGR